MRRREVADGPGPVEPGVAGILALEIEGSGCRSSMSSSASIELSFLGGATTIGASCTLVRVGGTSLVVDCGVRYSEPSSAAGPGAAWPRRPSTPCC